MRQGLTVYELQASCRVLIDLMQYWLFDSTGKSATFCSTAACTLVDLISSTAAQLPQAYGPELIQLLA